MAYQNVGTPRFYVNVVEWLMQNGAINLTDFQSKLFSTLPVNPVLVGYGVGSGVGDTTDDVIINGMTKNSFVALLGHKMASESAGDGIDRYLVLYPDGSGSFYVDSLSNVINTYIDGNYLYSHNDGFAIATFNEGTDICKGFDFNQTSTVGSIIIGTYYDMPNAPNLSLAMSREYGGIKEITTYTGGSMSNTMWSKPPKWGSLGAWELDGGTSTSQALSRSGRRTWDLKFSYMGSSDLWGSNQSLSKIMLSEDGGWSGEDMAAGQSTEYTWFIISQLFVKPSSNETVDYVGGYAPGSEFNAFMTALYNAGGRKVLGSGTAAIWSDDLDMWLGTMTSLQANEVLMIGVAEGTSYVTFDKLYEINWHENLEYADAAMTYHLNSEGFYPGDPTLGTDAILNYNVGNSTDTVGDGSNPWGCCANAIQTSLGEWDITTYPNLNTEDLCVAGGRQTFVPEYNILNDDNFFSQVWHKTLGGTLPFIFQPDKDNNNPDQFAICRFKENSLKATQTAHNVYDISLKIEEVW